MKMYCTDILREEIKIITEGDGFKTDYYWQYLYIINLVWTYRIRSRNNYECPINISMLRKSISYDNAHKLLNNLVSAGILETDMEYSKNVSSRKYTLKKEYLLQEWSLEEVQDNSLTSKYYKRREEQFRDICKMGYGYEKALKDLNKITIDKELAMRYIKTVSKDLGKHKTDYYKMSVELFDQKYFKVDTTGNRLHTNLTNLPSPLRRFLRASDKRLVQIDIKSSQPTFLGLKLKFDGILDHMEIARYLYICKSGEFYEFFANRCGESVDLKNSKVRRDFKTRLFRDLFFNVNRTELTCFEAVFKKEFPSIFNFMRDVKNKGNDKLASMLQREESSFIFNLVGRLDFESFTIHDSIITTEDNIDRLKTEMCNLFNEIYGFSPNLESEYLEKL